MTHNELRFTVPGPPVPWQRRVNVPGAPRGASTPKRSRNYRKHVRSCAQVAMLEHKIFEPWRGAVGLRLTILVSDRRVRDTDNCTKATKDALKGVIYLDDSQVVHEQITKALTERGCERVLCVVSRIFEKHTTVPPKYC